MVSLPAARGPVRPLPCITASPEPDQLAAHTAIHASDPTRNLHPVGHEAACISSWRGAVELLRALLEAEKQAGESLLRERALQCGTEGRGEAHLDRVGGARPALRGALERPGPLVATDELSAQELPVDAQGRLLDVQESELDGLHFLVQPVGHLDRVARLRAYPPRLTVRQNLGEAR